MQIQRDKLPLTVVDQYLPAPLKGRPKQYFAFTAEYLPLLASANAQPVNIQIQDVDSAFLVIAGTRIVTDVLNTTFFAAGPALVRIQDTASGQLFMDRPVHVDNLLGTAQFPAVWPYPRLVRGGGNLLIELTNLEAVARHYRITLHGFKVW